MDLNTRNVEVRKSLDSFGGFRSFLLYHNVQAKNFFEHNKYQEIESNFIVTYVIFISILIKSNH